jgi:hypothetical protein
MMLYLVVSLALIAAAVGLYARALLLRLPIPGSTRITLAVFLLAGIVMTYFSLKEIEPYQYERVEKICSDYPELQRMAAERRPVIQRYEYLEILEAETQAKKALTR